jgi:hypothetical protein
MQLVAYGAQDIYLTGNPQITFFKVVYRRHTNVAVEAIEQTFNGSANFEQKFSCTISRNGDLLHRVYLECDLDIKLNYTQPGTDDENVGVSGLSNMGFDIISLLSCSFFQSNISSTNKKPYPERAKDHLSHGKQG